MTTPNLEPVFAGVLDEFALHVTDGTVHKDDSYYEVRDRLAAHVVAAIRDSGYTVIATPTIDHLGPDRTVADMYAGVAWKLDNGYEPGGSNVTASVARTLRDIAAQHAGDTQ